MHERHSVPKVAQPVNIANTAQMKTHYMKIYLCTYAPGEPNIVSLDQTRIKHAGTKGIGTEHGISFLTIEIKWWSISLNANIIGRSRVINTRRINHVHTKYKGNSTPTEQKRKKTSKYLISFIVFICY